MAGDWIKVEHTLPDKPEVVRLAEILKMDQDAVTGKLLRFWIWCNQQSATGDALGVTNSFLDRLTNCSGFAAGLLEVGWLTSRNGALSVPNFDRHNTQTAKNRALTADRMKRQRDARSVTNASPEKRREEKSTEDPPTPRKPPGERLPDGFADFWAAYPRKEAKGRAVRAWQKIHPTAELRARMLEAVGRQKRSAKWLEENGRFIPHPATWLNDRRWEDEQEHGAGPAPGSLADLEQRAARTKAEMQRKREESP
jgi:hypothetical protein